MYFGQENFVDSAVVQISHYDAIQQHWSHEVNQSWALEYPNWIKTENWYVDFSCKADL